MSELPKSEAKAFAMVCDAAEKRVRCPTNEEFLWAGSRHDSVPNLARRGLVRILVYARNYRVVEILSGEHAGKSTKPPAEGGRPYRIIDSGGSTSGDGAREKSIMQPLETFAAKRVLTPKGER